MVSLILSRITLGKGQRDFRTLCKALILVRKFTLIRELFSPQVQITGWFSWPSAPSPLMLLEELGFAFCNSCFFMFLLIQVFILS